MRASAFLVLALLLAGCSSGGGDAGTSSRSSTTSGGEEVANLTANVTQVPLTDTLYLLRAPALNVTLPHNETTIATKGPYQAQTFVWNRTLNSTGNVTGGHLRLWLRLPYTSMQQGANNDPGCTIHWTLIMNNGTQRSVDGGCASLGFGPVPPGEYAFNITAPPIANPMEYAPGTNLRIQVTVGLVQPNGGLSYLLGGTETFDSHLALVGLQEPAVDPQAPDPEDA